MLGHWVFLGQPSWDELGERSLFVIRNRFVDTLNGIAVRRLSAHLSKMRRNFSDPMSLSRSTISSPSTRTLSP